jgi:hypothetical protein
MLALLPPQQYYLQIHDAGYTLSSDGNACTFSSPASTRGVAKLYTLAHRTSLLYVGIATQPMSSRLTYGFRAKGKGGYYGYKWKNLRHELKLSVWTARMGDAPASLRDLETVEAEVAFLCRHRSGQWPQYQHEIHFYPSAEHHRLGASLVYEHAVGEASQETPSK